MRNRLANRMGFTAAVCLFAASLHAQDAGSHVVPVPGLGSVIAVPDPKDPPARTVEDARDGIVFHLPPGWNLSRKDGELSTFHLDARSAPKTAQLRSVATIAFNPYPRSTFSGALVYLSVTPHARPQDCDAQATATPNTPEPVTVIGGKPFQRGHDEHGFMCTEARDEVFTAMRGTSCVRFDLAINSFCGGEASGARDMTQSQLENIELRMETIVSSVRFTKK
jgi:hypothetical protein